MTAQTWDPAEYARNARFVSDLGMPVVELLDPKPGERILDLGCGDGALTEKLIAIGCDVVGVDASAEQVEAARQRGIDARVVDARRLDFHNEFDAVFSNAVLHWVKPPADAVAGVSKALRSGGRFVGEFGGAGNTTHVMAGLTQALAKYGIDFAAVNPWYFPSPEEYAAVLESQGFRVDSIQLIPRPTPQPGPLTGWLETFGKSFLVKLPETARGGFFAEVQELLRPQLLRADGVWFVDYVRLRFAATLQGK